MIFITGDTHGNIDLGKLKIFAKANSQLTWNDYLIIAGDFGGVWYADKLKDTLKDYLNLPFTVLFIDGNHENFDLLNAYDVQIWHGGKVHKIADNIIHLMRGQVFEIESKTFFTFGGAESIDKHLRIEGVSWWVDEVPSKRDYDEALTNLAKVNNKVDYIITHSADEKALTSGPLAKFGFIVFPTSRALNHFEENIKYSHWYFGHFHVDIKINDRKTALYNKIVRII